MRWGTVRLFCPMCGQAFMFSGHCIQGVRHSKEHGYLCSINCYKTSEMKYTRMILGKNDESIVHGKDCFKQVHIAESGYLHSENDDSPYDVDGVNYCGRCHEVLP